MQSERVRIGIVGIVDCVFPVIDKSGTRVGRLSVVDILVPDLAAVGHAAVEHPAHLAGSRSRVAEILHVLRRAGVRADRGMGIRIGDRVAAVAHGAAVDAAYAADDRARAGIFPERAGKVAALHRAGIFAGNAAERTFRPAHTQQTVCAAQADRAGIQGDHAADARIIGRGMAGAFKNIRELEICRALFDGAAVIADDGGKAPDLGCEFGFYLQVADDRARLRLGKQGGIAAGGREHPKLADRVVLAVEGAGKTVLRARHGLERNQLRADHADVTFELR